MNLETNVKKSLNTCLIILVLISITGTAFAQDYDSHPELSDSFTISLGAFKSDHAFKISAEGSEGDIDDEIDFGKSVGVDESATILNAQFRWKFGAERKWSLWGQYFKNKDTGEAELNEDVEWEDVIFGEGSFVGAGVTIEIMRLFIGRSFVKTQQSDFGVGIGLHNLDISSYIEGDVLIDDIESGFQRVENSGSQPLPNIGAWYNFSPAKKWLIQGRVDWISANVGDYDGTLWNFNAGVNYQAFRHVGFGLSYQYFDLDLDIDNSDWRGNVNMRYSGPMLSATFSW
jgi:hypothetical protein